MDLEQLKSNMKKSKDSINEVFHLNKTEMEAIIKKQTDKTTHGLSRLFLMGIVVQSLTILIQLINLIRYSEVNDLLIGIVISIGLASLALLYTINRYSSLKSEIFNVLSLSESLKRKIEFYKISYNKWLLSFAASFVVFVWSINILAGDFTSLQAFNLRILILYTLCFLLIFFSNRYAASKYLRAYEISLNDLGGNHLTDLKKINEKFMKFKIVLIGILFLFLITGLIFFLLYS